MRPLVAIAALTLLAGCKASCDADLTEYCTADCPTYHQEAADCQVTSNYKVEHCAGYDIVTCGDRDVGVKYWFMNEVLAGVTEYDVTTEKTCDGHMVYGDAPEDCR